MQHTMIQHEFFMRACIALAVVAKQNGESPVGAVIVHKGIIIGEGIECNKAHQDITFHAEIEAIRRAIEFLHTQHLADCILYTTHEPCMMCSYVIRQSKIPVVFAGLITAETGGYSSHLQVLADREIKKWGKPPMFISGILAPECQALHVL